MMPCCKPFVFALCLLVQVSLAARPNVLMIGEEVGAEMMRPNPDYDPTALTPSTRKKNKSSR